MGFIIFSPSARGPGSGLIWKNLQSNFRWKRKNFELDFDIKYSDFDLKADGSSFSTYMRDMSLGFTFRNVFLRLKIQHLRFFDIETEEDKWDAYSYHLGLYFGLAKVF